MKSIQVYVDNLIEGGKISTEEGGRRIAQLYIDLFITEIDEIRNSNLIYKKNSSLLIHSFWDQFKKLRTIFDTLNIEISLDSFTEIMKILYPKAHEDIINWVSDKLKYESKSQKRL